MTRSLRPFAVGASALLLGTALALGTALPAMADTPPTGAVIDQQNTTSGTFGGSQNGNGQSFTAGVSGLLTSVHLALQSGSGAGSVDLYALDSGTGLPTGSILGSAPFTGATIPDGVANFTTPVTITSGDEYALVWGDAWIAPLSTGDAYAGGMSLFRDSSNVWHNSANDYVFATYVIPDPTAANSSATVQEGKSVGIPLTFTGGATAAVGTAPTHGTVTFSGTTATYTSDPGFTGADTFTYTATNPAGVSDPATVTVTVTPPPPPAPTLAKTGVDSGWLLWPAAGVLLLGIIAVVVAAIVRRRRAAD